MSLPEEISLKELLEKAKFLFLFLLRRWKLLLLVGVIGGTTGWFYAQSQKPVYTASLSFAVEDEKGGGSGLSGALGLASSLGLSLGSSGGGAFSGANLMELIKSRKMIEQALLKPVIVGGKQQSLADYYIQIDNSGKKQQEGPVISFPLNVSRSTYTIAQDSVLGLIYTSLALNGINVGLKDKKASIVNIDVKSHDQLFSKVFLETLVDEVTTFYVETKSKKARLNFQLIERQVDSIRTELNSAITGVASANDHVFGLNSALNVMRAPSQRRQVDVQANTAILTELVKNQELARLTLRQETPLIQVIDQPILPLRREKMSRLITAISAAMIFSILTAVILISIRWWKTMNQNDEQTQ